MISFTHLLTWLILYLKLVALSVVQHHIFINEWLLIFIPVQLLLPQGDAHANVLIYRKNLNQIEHFEPHGSSYMGSEADFINKEIAPSATNTANY